MRIILDDGRTIASRVDAALGRGPDSPLPPDALAAKFADCAGRALPGPQVVRLQQVLLQLHEAPSLRDIIAMVAMP